MKSLRWILVAMLLLGLTVAVVGCGGEDPTATPVPTNTPPPPPTDTPVPPPPTDTPVPPPPTEEAAPEPDADTDTDADADADTDSDADTNGDSDDADGGTDSDGQSLDTSALASAEELDSFRSLMEIRWSGIDDEGNDVSESMMIEVEFVREPPAQHVTIGGAFPGMEELGMGSDEVLEMYVVEGIMYMNLFGSWMQVPAEEGGLDADQMAFVATDEMLADLEGADYEGTTTYNGIEVEHYTFNEASFAAEEMGGMEVEEASGNIYIAKDGGYLVHMDMAMTGANLDLPTGEGESLLQNGTMEVLVDLTDINVPITIEVPPEALEAGTPPEDIPVPDDAEEMQYVDFMGMITFFSPQTTEEVAEYYRAEMPNMGWTENSFDDVAGMFMIEYSKGDRTASLMIMEDSDSGRTSVMISIEGGGE